MTPLISRFRAVRSSIYKFLALNALNQRCIKTSASMQLQRFNKIVQDHHPLSKHKKDIGHGDAKYINTSITSQENSKNGNNLSQKNNPNVDLTFSNAEEAFKSKSTWEILRAWLIFKILTIHYIADNQMKLMKLSEKVFGKTLFETLMKVTFYGHFVAGEDQKAITPKIKRMQKFGVNAILDYSAEEDVDEDAILDIAPPPDPVKSEKVNPSKQKDSKMYEEVKMTGIERQRHALCRTYFYKNETSCDKNMNIFLNSIKAVAGTGNGSGFAAIKMTALAKPQYLLKVSEAIEGVHHFVKYFTGIKDAVHNQSLKYEELKQTFLNASNEDPDVRKWLDEIEKDNSGVINLLPWKPLLLSKKSLKIMLRIPNPVTGRLEPLITPFTAEETEAFHSAIDRCHTVFKLAKELNVRVMVDAEQTYLQPAISRLTMEMMKIYNVDKPLVFNTYQCYLKEAYRNLVTDLNQAKRQKFYFGCKLVRGAYMHQERQRAQTLGYDDPINPSYEATTQMYEKCMDQCLSCIIKNDHRVQVMAASHNEDTVRYVITKMTELGIDRGADSVYFGQLYGMCDQVSFPLGQAGYQVYKYVPYGPVSEVLPYLSRRAQENKGFLGKTTKERQILMTELIRRLRTGQFRHAHE